ncbi:MAG: cphA [Ferruginibacter sp.]|nr:cphA [Ferruginibacter sp.]
MKIEHLRILDGPNYWSIRRKKLIVLQLDLEELEQLPTNKIDGFYERLKALLPSLYSHRCSEGVAGGFFERVKEGTWMGHVIEHVALELQTLAGMDTGFGRTRATGRPGVYHVVFSYVEPRAGEYAARAAINIVSALQKGETYDLQKDIEALSEIYEADRFGPSTGSLVAEAVHRNIPYIRLNESALVQLGYGVHQKRIEATIAGTTSNIAVELAGDKEATKNILSQSAVPVPKGGVASDAEELRALLEDIGYPVVIKPLDGNQGKGATTNINNWEEALRAYEAARNYSPVVICERCISGYDYRALVINYKFVAAAKRRAASVTGNGIHTIQQLVDEVNKDPRRGNGHQNVMTRILVDNAVIKLLEKQGYALDTVLLQGTECWLKTTANLSTGGTATDVTDTVHPKNILLFNRIARVIGLDICGIDIMAKDLSRPLAEVNGAIIEVNAAPGFRMHLQPSYGVPRNVAAPVIDMLFPPGSPSAIPIIAITGTNGKTTTTRLVAHMCRQQGFTTGYTTTDGIYIQDLQVMDGDCSGPASARTVLMDPSVEMAVLECARGGILRAGLAFSECDVAIITNVAEDHLGLAGIETIGQLARVKSVVAESVKPEGYAILNADDDLVYAMKKDLSCNIALFSLREANSRIIEHCSRKGIAAIYESNYITILHGAKSIRIDEVSNIPLTFSGKAEFNIANVLAAVLAGYVQDFDMDAIRGALNSFIPSPELTPGRMNFFDFNEFTVMIDYAHNPHGLHALGKFIKAQNAVKNIGVIAGIGDRRDEDIVAVGKEAGQIFDEVIVRMDDFLRGRQSGEILELLNRGIKEVKEDLLVTYMPDEGEAVRLAISKAAPGTFVVVLVDKVEEAIQITAECKQREQAQLTAGASRTYL